MAFQNDWARTFSMILLSRGIKDSRELEDEGEELEGEMTREHC